MMSDKLLYSGKNWGRSALIGCFNDVLVYQAIVEKGKSSIHLHNYDVNIITSIDAVIRILFFDDGHDNPFTSSVVLEPGGRVVIKPNRVHQFLVISPGAIVEIYYSGFNAQKNREFDITRFNA